MQLEVIETLQHPVVICSSSYLPLQKQREKQLKGHGK